MPNRVEAYTVTGVATGAIPRSGPVREVLEGASDVVVEGAQWLPLDGSGERAAGDLRLLVDDLLLVVSDEPDGVPVHAQWHSIELDAGPYRVYGEMPTMPGFDPGRALARPTGEFVVLRDARIVLIDHEDAGEASSAQLLVNRYTVDRIAADLMLGFFFPGARMTITGSSAGEHEATPAAAAVATVTTVTTPASEPEAPAAVPAESA